MNKQVVIEIANAKNRIDSIQELNARFLAYAQEHSTPQDIPTKLEVTAHGIAVHCFGYNAETKPRVVQTSDGEFSIEYVFFIAQDEDRHEVWRFYLTADGRLYESLRSPSGICDFNNQYVANHICSRLLFSVLKSPIFVPLPKAGG
jgi:hypothetical protein